MHQAQAYINNNLLPLAGAAGLHNFPLPAASANGLQIALKGDACGYCYSGSVSIADAIRGINSGFYSWATVKLYYATFYLTRALLALKGASIFYIVRSPYRWLAKPGAVPKKLSGNTHNVVLDEFVALGFFPTFIGQQIATAPPLQWLRQRREQANYGSARFEEPNPPDHFTQVSSIGVRSATEAYLSDKTLLYVFDEDHAMLAYPIELLKRTVTEINTILAPNALPERDRIFMTKLYKDDKGPIPGIARLFAI